MRYTLTVEFETWKQLTAFVEATKSSGKGKTEVILPPWTKVYDKPTTSVPAPKKEVPVKDGTSAEFAFNVLVGELDKYGESGLTTLQLWKALRSAKFPYGRSWMNQILKEFDSRGLIKLHKIGHGGHGRFNRIFPVKVEKAV